MTPAQLTHLRAIDAHLANLLDDIAAKRTPGEWKFDGSDLKSGKNALYDIGDYGNGYGLEDADASYIAACSNNAEAGWKATREAIADWLSLYNSSEGYADGAPDASVHDKLCNEVASTCRINLQHILSAFPLEIIK